MSSLRQTLIIAIISINVWNAGSVIVFSDGPCPSIPAVENLDLTEFAKTWYHFKQTASPFTFSPTSQEGGTCATSTFSNVNGRNFDIEFSEKVPSKTTVGKAFLDSSAGTQAIYDFKQFNLLPVTIFHPLNPHFDWNDDGNYRVLETDGDNFAIVYGCEFVIYKFEFIMVLTKDKEPDSNTKMAIDAALCSAKFNELAYVKSFLQEVKQNCA